MKKIRIELKPDVRKKSLLLFESSESLYLWLNEFAAPADPHGSFYVDLEQGDFVEAEWRGCEFVYEGHELWRRLDIVRLAKSSQTKNGSGTLVSIHYGWVTTDLMTFSNREEPDSYTWTLPNPEDWKLDLNLLFMDSDEEQVGEDREVEGNG